MSRFLLTILMALALGIVIGAAVETVVALPLLLDPIPAGVVGVGP